MDIFRKRPLCIAVSVFVLSLVLLMNAFVWVKFLLIAAACISGTAAIFKFKKLNLFVGVMLALLLSSLLSLLYFDGYVDSAAEWYGKSGKLRIEIIDVNYNSVYSSYADVKILDIDGEKVNYKARLESSYSIDADRGEIFVIEGTLSDFEEDPLFNSKRYYNSRGYYLNILSENNTMTYIGKAGFSLTSFFKDINEFCEYRLKTVLDEDTFGFANGIFLGNREDIDPKLNRDFTELGVSHMIAISGMHLSILIGSIYSILLHFGLHRRITIGISIAICVFYIGITGATPAILRSGIMFIIMSISTLVMRENDSITSLFATVGIIIFLMPNAVFDVAFLLSCFSTFGILIIFPRLKRFSEWSKSKNKFVSVCCGVLSGFAVTVFATIFTFPLTAYYFGRFYYLLPLTNLIFELPTTLILMLSPFVVVFSFVPYIGAALSYVCKLITLFMSFIAELITSLDVGSVSLSYPFVTAIIVIFFAVVLIMVVFEVRNPLWIFLPLALSIGGFAVCQSRFLCEFRSYDYIYCQNSVRNDIMAIRASDATTVVDICYGGRSSAQNVFKAASELFYDNRIDSYILTHYHNYHPATIDKITRAYYIETLYLPRPSEDDVEIAEQIYDICNKNDVKCVYYEGVIELSKENTVKVDSGFVKRSKHPVISVEIGLNGFFAAYLSPAAFELYNVKELPDVVFFGLHGPKIREANTAFNVDIAVYSDESVRDAYKITVDESVILDDENPGKVIRIKR